MSDFDDSDPRNGLLSSQASSEAVATDTESSGSGGSPVSIRSERMEGDIDPIHGAGGVNALILVPHPYLHERMRQDEFTHSDHDYEATRENHFAVRHPLHTILSDLLSAEEQKDATSAEQATRINTLATLIGCIEKLKNFDTNGDIFGSWPHIPAEVAVTAGPWILEALCTCADGTLHRDTNGALTATQEAMSRYGGEGDKTTQEQWFREHGLPAMVQAAGGDYYDHDSLVRHSRQFDDLLHANQKEEERNYLLGWPESGSEPDLS